MSKYAVLEEHNGRQNESWLYFIKYDGNEEELELLQQQLKSVEWYILEELSVFELDLMNLVSEQTAKEMTKIDLNHSVFHRRFNGKLLPIDFRFKTKDTNELKICKVFDILGYGSIEEFIDGGDCSDVDEPEDKDNSHTNSGHDDKEDDSEGETLYETLKKKKK